MQTEILEHVARTLWLDVWATWQESLDDCAIGPGAEIDDCAPETPDWCLSAANDFAAVFEGINGKSLERALTDLGAEDRPGRYGAAADRFGHCLALQSRGHGVGLGDFAWEYSVPLADSLEVPYTLECIEYEYVEAPIPDGDE